jgi:hypothetical protein
MEILQLTPLALAVLALLIGGTTELIKRIFARDWKAVTTIAAAAVIGGLLGLSHYQGLDFVSGLAAGFSTVGAFSLAGTFTNKSSATPSEVVVK